MRRIVVTLIPPFLRPAARNIYHSSVDLLARFKGREGMVPPQSAVFVGGGDFDAIGREFTRYFVDLAHLRPDERVLDVGCGIGRMAVPLTEYLSGRGEYWGFDIVREGIDWCRRRISPRFGNFHFLHADVYNKAYNPSGKILARDFRFPFDDNSFDFVLLTSVFTHMLRGDLENYISEISRVLKPGGRCGMTFFVLNEESRKQGLAGKSNLEFRFELDGCWTTNEEVPESATAYDEVYLQGLLGRCALAISGQIHYGGWSGRETFLSYQDLVIAKKLVTA